MRLIDKDKLIHSLEIIPCKDSEERATVNWIIDEIDEKPRVRAIPVEWIMNKYMEKWEKAEMGRRDFQFCEVIHDLLEMWDEEKEDWEKENEKDSE